MPTTIDRIEENSALYGFLKVYVDFLFRKYYRVTVNGLENIPSEGTLIFAANHQNALMDALAMLCVRKGQPVFMARADIFKNPTVRKILTFLKIMPVYRIRDGYENLSLNDEIFKKTIDVIRNRNGLVILPEGNHCGEKRLRPLKKGIARIALQAEEAMGGELDIRVVPVGIDYTNYMRVGSRLHVSFGVAIRVAPLLLEYKNSPAKAYNILLNLLTSGLKSEMVHIADEKYYSASKSAIESYSHWRIDKAKQKQTHINNIEFQQKAAQGLEKLKDKSPDDYLVLMAAFMELSRDLKEFGFPDGYCPLSRKKKILSVLVLFVLVLTSPLFVYAAVNNAVSLGIPYLFSKKFMDEQFHSSVRFALALFLLPIFHAIQVVTFAFLTANAFYTILYAVSLPLSTYFFFRWKEQFNLNCLALKEIAFGMAKNKLYNRTKLLHNKVVKKVDDLCFGKKRLEMDQSFFED
jgi:1-acyl-sn-glycerol-3-phosphate acyltransferase